MGEIRVDALVSAGVGDWLYSPETQLVYTAEGVVLGRNTYQNAISESPWYAFWKLPYRLCVVDYATASTAEVILQRVASAVPQYQWKVEWLVKTGQVSHAEAVLVAQGRHQLQLNAGRQAFTYDKNGPTAWRDSLIAEIKFLEQGAWE